MLTAQQRKFLVELCPAEDVLFEPEQTDPFASDSSRLYCQPLAVVRPRRVEQIQKIMAWSYREKIAIYPRGSGTNMVGACVPVQPGIVLSTLAMNNILEINPGDFTAVLEPGVITARLQNHVERQGLFYPPDPASAKLSTIGGNVATGAGGLRAVKYGATRDYVLGLQAVLPGGRLIHTGGRTHKNAVGFDLNGLLTGSEGLLAVITRITLKLLPKPQASASLLLGYPDADKAIEASQAVFQAGFLPVAMEIMPEETLDCLSMTDQTMPWPAEARAVIIIKLDGSREALAAELEELKKAIAPSAPVYMREGRDEDEDKLWAQRRLINPASFSLGPDKMSNDIVVPRSASGEALKGIRAIAGQFRQKILAFGHLGDGNIHVNIMYDARDAEQSALARQARDEVLALTLALKGSISGEHGVGLAKADWLERQISASEMELMTGIKKIFDPLGLLNPGKWLYSASH